MVINLTGYIFNDHEYNRADRIVIHKACSTGFVFESIEFNGTVSLKVVNSTIFQ